MTAIDSASELNSILEEWNSQNSALGLATVDHIPKLKRICELIEQETEAYYKMDPDPFDNRHPGRSSPTCVLGHLFKVLFKNEEFMNKLVSSYVMSGREQLQLQIASCRLLLDVLPGLETTVVFQETEGLVEQLLQWAETADEPLCYYAAGLLSGAMEVQDIASSFKEKNANLVPKMIQRLHRLQRQMEVEKREEESSCKDDRRRHFSMFAKTGESAAKSPGRYRSSVRDRATVEMSSESVSSKIKVACESEQEKSVSDGTGVGTSISSSYGKVAVEEAITSSSDQIYSPTQHRTNGELGQSTVKSAEQCPQISQKCEAHDVHTDVLTGLKRKENTLEERKNSMKRTLSPSFHSEELLRVKKTYRLDESMIGSDLSNSSWADLEPYVIGSYSLEPLTLSMKQRLIIQYLTPMGEYQELISAAFEQRALDLLFFYINLKCNIDVRLAFEALKYLAVLLCHKKFAIEFLQRAGVEKLLDVYRPSIAATGVSICLYYLSYFEDAMERVCLLPDHILTSLVHYVLWLLECSHDSSRCHAAMFFGQSFPFHVILEKFDQQDGLRRLYNVISTLQILNVDSSGDTLNEDQVFTMRQAARHVCVALKKYFEIHLILKVNELKRAHTRNEGGSPQHETPPYKAIKLSGEVIQESVELLMELMPVRLHWAPETTFHKLGGIQLLCQLIAMAPEWNSYTGKPETIRSALDVIAVCCVTSKSQLALLESVPLQDDHTTPAISIPIGLSEGEVLADAEVQKAALSVIVNCVCGPVERLGAGVGRYMGTGAKKKINWKIGEDVLSKMWNGVRLNNGIMVLLKLLSAKTPITDADSIRTLACKALVGLARCDTVRQIISKLPLFSNGQLQMLMKEPVLQDRRQEHVKFCKYASSLIETVSGQQAHRYSDASIDDIRRADIVAQSKISFHEKELLQLIHSHLLNKGYSEAASALQREAGLPGSISQPVIHPASPNLYTVPSTTSPKLSRLSGPPAAGAPQSAVSSVIGAGAVAAATNQWSQGTSATCPTTPGPIRFTINRHSQSMLNGSTSSRPSSMRSKFNKDHEHIQMTPVIRRSFQRSHTAEYEMTLDKIVTEYLRKQHGLCRSPVVTCPPMSLFVPHRCLEARGNLGTLVNLTARLHGKSISPRLGELAGASLDRKFVYSRFKPIRTYRETDEDGFSCCTFTACGQYMMLGSNAGDLKLINLYSGEETTSTKCHSSPLTYCQHSNDGELVLTSSAYMSIYNSKLWTWGKNLENKYNFVDQHIEFSKHVQDRIVGTVEEVAHVYDVATGQRLLKLYEADKANNYKENRATFNPTDDLVLNDGVIWDVRSGKSIHKFDKFNQYVSGVFHPMGLEIIINSEVWDVRSFRLLHTVPALDHCQIRFSHLGDVIYAIHFEEDLDTSEEKYKNPYSSTFRTFDATSYNSIATIDVKSSSISDLCADPSDCYLAVVEDQHYTETGAQENVCKVYEIGKLKDAEDDQADEEEDGIEDDDEDDDDLLHITEDDTTLEGSSPDIDVDEDDNGLGAAATDGDSNDSHRTYDDDDDEVGEVQFELEDDVLFELG